MLSKVQQNYLCDGDGSLLKSHSNILGGVLNGSQQGPAGIKPEQLTRKVWDYIFLGGSYPETDIPEGLLTKKKKKKTKLSDVKSQKP